MRGQLTKEQRLQQINTRLKNQNILLRKKVSLLEEKVELQAKTIQTLELRIEELMKMIFRGKKKKKENGEENAETGKKEDPNAKKDKESRSKESYQRSIPKEEEITEVFLHTKDICDCGASLTKKKITLFYIEDIELPRNKENEVNGNAETETKNKKVEKHSIEQGWCPNCKKWICALPLPPSKVMLGENAKLYITYLAILLRVSYDQIQKLFKDTYRFTLSDGEIGNVLEREANLLSIPFEQLKDCIRKQKGVHFDETSWNVSNGEQGNFAWVMTGTENSDAVFLVGRSRGKGNAKELMGKEDESKEEMIGISDDYGAYRHLFKIHQLCRAHPNRKIRDLATSNALDEATKNHCKQTYQAFSQLYQDLRDTMDLPFDLKEREKKKEDFLQRMESFSFPDKKDPKKLENIKKSFWKHKEKYLVCITREGIPADNNKAERSLRHLVLKRKISFGSKTQKGADRLSILFSVLLSIRNRKPENFFSEYARVRREERM